MKCTQCLNRCNKMQCNWLGKIYSSHFPVAIFSILCVCTHLIFVNCVKVLHVGMILCCGQKAFTLLQMTLFKTPHFRDIKHHLCLSAHFKGMIHDTHDRQLNKIHKI